MLRQHFRDLHPFDKVVVSMEGYFPWWERCVPQTHPDAEVPDRGGVEVTKRIGGTFGIGLTPPVLSPRGCAEMH
jgi:hypothetical protein